MNPYRRYRTIEGVLPKIPRKLLYTPYLLSGMDNTITSYMGKWYFR